MIALDIEASSPNPPLGSILSIGAIDTDEPTNQFYDECRIWDGAQVLDEALLVNGFSREEIIDPDKKSEKELIEAFVAWATARPLNRTIIGQNPSFDRDYVKFACLRAGIEMPLPERSIDTHTLCWSHMISRGKVPPTENRRSALNLDAILTYCGIPEEPKPHNALTGAQCHAEVFSRIAYNKKMLPEFFQYNLSWSA